MEHVQPEDITVMVIERGGGQLIPNYTARIARNGACIYKGRAHTAREDPGKAGSP